MWVQHHSSPLRLYSRYRSTPTYCPSIRYDAYVRAQMWSSRSLFQFPFFFRSKTNSIVSFTFFVTIASYHSEPWDSFLCFLAQKSRKLNRLLSILRIFSFFFQKMNIIIIFSIKTNSIPWLIKNQLISNENLTVLHFAMIITIHPLRATKRIHFVQQKEKGVWLLKQI